MSIQKEQDDLDALDIDTSLPVENIETSHLKAVGIVDTPYPPPTISKSYHPFQPAQIKRKERQIQRDTKRKKKQGDEDAAADILMQMQNDNTSVSPLNEEAEEEEEEEDEEIAGIVGVKDDTNRKWARGHTWEGSLRSSRGKLPPKVPETPQKMYATGNYTVQEMADTVGVSSDTIRKEVKENNWKGSFRDERSKLTPKVYETVQKMYASGNHTVQEMADKVDVKDDTIRKWMKDNNWKGSLRSYSGKLTPRVSETVQRMYASGNHTVQEIADAVNVSDDTIRKGIKDNNWKGSLRSNRGKFTKLTPGVSETAQRMYKTGNHTALEIADTVGVQDDTIRKWARDNEWEGSYRGSPRSSPRASPRTIRLTPELSGGKRKTKKNTKQSRKKSHRKRKTKKSKQTRRK